MTTATAARFTVTRAGDRRVVITTAAGRPDLRLPEAHPARRPQPGRTASVASCAAVRPARVSPLLALKVAAVGALTVLGTVVSVQNLALAEPDPALGYVAGDPAWAHVTQP